MKNKKGITLVSLIITILVMLILTAVIITTAISENGIIDRVENARIEHERSEIEEIIKMSYVFKTTASQTTYAYLDLEKTADAIYGNLTANGFIVKTEDGEKVTSGADIYSPGDTNFDLNIEGKTGEFECKINQTGLEGEIKVKEEEKLENNPNDTTSEIPEDTTPSVEEKYLTLSTNVDQIFTQEFKKLFATLGSPVPQNVAKLIYKSNEYTLNITSGCNDTMGSTNLVIVEYYKNDNLINTYILRCTGGYYFDDDGNAEWCHGYPHYSTGWTDKTIVKGTCPNCNGNIYGILSETEFPKFTGEWEIDNENSNDYGKQYLTNVLIEK